MQTNQTSMMGPNARPITAVPRRWMTNSAVRMTTAAGSTIRVRPGSMTAAPSRALITEIAGVIIESP